MKNKKIAAEVFLFQRNDLSLQSKIEPLHIVVTKTVNNNNKTYIEMKKVFIQKTIVPLCSKICQTDDMFLSRSTVATKETIEFEGETYPLLKIEISSTSHPFYTGKSKLVDTAGRVDKFMSRYGNRMKK